MSKDEPHSVVEQHFKEETQETKLSPLARVWRDFVVTSIMPYDSKERRGKLAHVFEELARYVESHEAMKLGERWAEERGRSL